MEKKIKAGFISLVPLNLLEGRVEPVLVTLLAEKYKSYLDLLMKEGEEGGVELTSPLIAKILVPILRREGIDKFVVSVPADMREIVTVLETEGIDFFVFRYMPGIEQELERLKNWLPSDSSGVNIREKILNLDRYLKGEEEKYFSQFTEKLFSISGVTVDPGKDFKCGKTKIGLLGELPPFTDFYRELCRLFNPVFIELPYLLSDEKFFLDPGVVSSPAERLGIYREVAEEREIEGFFYLYYSLSPWQNYEIILRGSLSSDVIPLEIKSGTGFEEREKLRIEAFYRRITNKQGGIL